MLWDTKLPKLALSQPSKPGTARKSMHACCITARHEACLLGWDKGGAKRSLPCILKQDVQMHTQHSDSHRWRSLRLNSSKANCVAYRIGSTVRLVWKATKASHQQRVSNLHTIKAYKLSRAAEALMLLPNYCCEDTLYISAVKLTRTSLDTSCAALPHSHLCDMMTGISCSYPKW